MLVSTNDQPHSHWSAERYRKTEIPSADAIASSLTGFGGTIKNAFGEGLTMMENKMAGIIQETKKLQMRKKTESSFAPNESAYTSVSSVSPNQTDYETQLKASRDVSNAMAAKAKLLLRELKIVRANLAFAKERCSQLEEKNKILRESRQKGDNPADDDLIHKAFMTYIHRVRSGGNCTKSTNELNKMIAFNTLVATELVADMPSKPVIAVSDKTNDEDELEFL